MKPKRIDHTQGLLFQGRLSNQLDPAHHLRLLAELIDWKVLEGGLAPYFVADRGAPGKPVRLVVGLLMLQSMFQLSDAVVVERWIENGYWQFFCGYDHLQWDFPVDPSSLTRWRRRLGKEGMELILQQTVDAAKACGAVSKSSLKKAVVDTTVMPKNITFPTDSKLYYRALCALVRAAKKRDLRLRQSYARVSKRALVRSSRYAHARQMNRSKRETKRLKTWLGRVYREVSGQADPSLDRLLSTTRRILEQERTSKNKVYSVHEPEVSCIAKGKAGKKYEFGCKVSLVATLKEGLVLSSEALAGNPYDGHTLKDALAKAEQLSGTRIERVYADKGYRGHGDEEHEVFISGQRRGVTCSIKKELKRRQSIEPHIGHMKNENRLGLNRLSGRLGDQLNALLAGLGHNLNFLRRHLRLSIA
jgi:transposase, IS5 family